MKENALRIDKTPKWINNNNTEYFKSDRFQKMFRVFLLSVPNKDLSARGKPIAELKLMKTEEELFIEIIGTIRYEYRKQYIHNSALLGVNLLSFPPAVTDLDERVCFSGKDDTLLTDFLIHIRSSLAHGRFNIMGPKDNLVFVMENMTTKVTCCARMILKADTLGCWAEIIEAGFKKKRRKAT